MALPMLETALARLARMNEIVSEVGRGLAGILLLAMLAVVMLQVFFRYILNDSLIWTEEFSKAMMVWSAFLVAPFAMRRGSNVAIAMLVLPLSPRVQAMIRAAIDLAVIAVLIAFFYESIGFVARGHMIMAASVALPMSVFYAIVPVGFLALILTGIELLVRDIMIIRDPAGDYALAPISPLREGE